MNPRNEPNNDGETYQDMRPVEPDVDIGKFSHISHLKKRVFLQRYAVSNTIVEACREARISAPTYRKWKREDLEFAAALKEAREMSFEFMLKEARRRALIGRRKLVLHKGQPVLVPVDPMNPNGDKQYHYEYCFSDILLMFLMKAAKPQKFRDNPPPLPTPDPANDPAYDDLSDLPAEMQDEILDRIDAARNGQPAENADSLVGHPDQRD